MLCQVPSSGNLSISGWRLRGGLRISHSALVRLFSQLHIIVRAPLGGAASRKGTNGRSPSESLSPVAPTLSSPGPCGGWSVTRRVNRLVGWRADDDGCTACGGSVSPAQDGMRHSASAKDKEKEATLLFGGRLGELTVSRHLGMYPHYVSVCVVGGGSGGSIPSLRRRSGQSEIWSFFAVDHSPLQSPQKWHCRRESNVVAPAAGPGRARVG